MSNNGIDCIMHKKGLLDKMEDNVLGGGPNTLDYIFITELPNLLGLLSLFQKNNHSINPWKSNLLKQKERTPNLYF